MSSQSIGEFLVSLGWDTNETQQQEFERMLFSVTLKVRLLTDGLEELARKVLDSVSEIATNFDRLYFQAQRTNTAAATVSDFVRVMGQAGVAAGQAAGSIENMAAKLRAGHIAVQDLNRMGFGLNPLTHQLEVQQKYVANMAGMSDAMVVAGANLVGMDVEVARQMKRQGAAIVDQMDALADYRKKLGFDLPQAEADGNKIASIWRDTQNKLAAIGQDMGDGLIKALVGPLQVFNDFLSKNAPEIGRDIDIIMSALLKMTDAWTADLSTLINDPKAMEGFKDDMHSVAVSIADMARDFNGFIKDMVWLNQVGGDVINRLVGAVPQGGYGIGMQQLPGGDPGGSGPGRSPSGPAGGGGGAGVAPAAPAEDNRTWWQRHAPAALGGLPDPAAAPAPGGGLRGGGGGGGDRHHSAATGEAMNVAMDQLRKEGVPEESIRPAAALLVGNALAESGLNPETVHDNGTGYGIYGARLERRERMFSWMEKNGYARNSLEGQTRYMAHEAMSMDSVAPLLRGASADNLMSNSAPFTRAFENPKVVNNRTGDVRAAYGAVGAGPTASNDYGDLRLTPDAAAGGAAEPGLIALAHHVQDTEDVERFHAFHDTAHLAGGRVANPNSLHNRGLAFDVSINGRNYEGARERVRAYLTGLGMAEGGMGGGAGDFAIEPGTRDHLHVQFQNHEAAAKYLALTGAPDAPAVAAPQPAAGVDFLNAMRTGGPLGGNLLGNVRPTLGGAAGTAGTTVHAPMDTKIIIEGAGAGPDPTPNMVGAGMTHKPADLTRNLQGGHA
jgi:hypothetical protein